MRERFTASEVVLFETRIGPASTGGALTHLEGRAVPYGVWTNRGWFLESIAAGALDKSIGESAASLPLLLFHDDNSYPVGASEKWRSSTKYLDGFWRLDESDEAQEAARLARDGFLTGLSVGITPIRSDWTMIPADDWNPDLGPDHMDKVARTEARLVETSLVSTPAFVDAQIKLVHTSTPRRFTSTHPRLDAARRWLDEVRAG